MPHIAENCYELLPYATTILHFITSSRTENDDRTFAMLQHRHTLEKRVVREGATNSHQ